MTYNPSSIWDLFHSEHVFYYTEPYWLLCFSWATVLSSFSLFPSFKTSIKCLHLSDLDKDSFGGILGVKCWLKWAEKKSGKEEFETKGRLSLEELDLSKKQKDSFSLFCLSGGVKEKLILMSVKKSKTYHHRCQEYHSRWECQAQL